MDYKLTTKEKKLGFDSFEKTIKAAIAGKIDYKKYHFVLDEDGNLYFLKKDDDCRDEGLDAEDLKRWPCNCYDGIELWSVETGSGRGTDITAMFLDALKAKYLF